MSRRLLPLLVAPLLVLVAASGCAKDVSPAVRVGDVRISDRELIEEVREWVGNPEAIDEAVVAGWVPGTFPMALVGQIISQRVDFELTHAEFVGRGLRLTDEQRQTGVRSYFRGDVDAAQSALGGFSAGYANEFVDRISEQNVLQEELGVDLATWRAQAFQAADVEVSPRYGTWDGTRGQVLPPEGPDQPGGSLDFGL